MYERHWVPIGLMILLLRNRIYLLLDYQIDWRGNLWCMGAIGFLARCESYVCIYIFERETVFEGIDPEL